MMKEFNDIDQLFRSSLADYKPVPEAQSKERFLASATGLWAGSTGSGLNWKYLLLAAVLLLGVSGTLYLYFSPKQEQQTRHSQTQITSPDVDRPVTEVPETVANTDKERILANNNDNTEKSEISATQPLNTDAGQEEISTINSDNNSDATIVANNTDLLNTGTEISTAETFHEVTYNTNTERTPVVMFALSSLDISRQVPGLDNKPSGLLYREIPLQPFPKHEPGDEDYKRVRKNSVLNMAYSAHYRPELIFNIIDNNKVVHNFGVDVHFKLFNDKYIIRTGISSSISKGYYEYAVLYNEYLGSYEGLDSITFQWDENHYHLIPTYHTSEREVFDTAVQTDVTKVYKRFTYLQIPLMLGYDFITHKSFSMGARLGPTLSILLSDNTLSDEYDPGKHRVIQVNQITPDRIETNWMLSAGVNFGFYSKKRLFYEIEPQFSYYFNSVYQKYDVSNPPFSIGIRLSIGIK
jgi:hypothetical protein